MHDKAPFRDNINLLLFTIRLSLPRFKPHIFLVFMLRKFVDIEKCHKHFHIQPLNSEDFEKTAQLRCPLVDTNNTVLVLEGLVKTGFALIKIKVGDISLTRRVAVITSKSVNQKSGNILYVNYNLWFNIKQALKCVLKEEPEIDVMFAEELDISLINTSDDWSNHFVDTMLKSYFQKPKILYSGDIIGVSLQEFGRELIYSSNKISNSKGNVYFKCNNVVAGGKWPDRAHCFCLFGETNVRQSANKQSFIVQTDYTPSDSGGLALCPFGLQNQFDEIRKSFVPFVKHSKSLRNLRPVFLVEGRKGSGKHVLISSLASSLGLHLDTVYSFELAANVYAQYELKQKNLFFGAKLAAPCLLEIRNFENFAKNTDGQYDERLINHFATELAGLSSASEHPVIVACSSNDKDIPIELRRVFLKSFELKAPTEKEREDNLRWLIIAADAKNDADLEKVAANTHGFLFEDLKALVAAATAADCQLSPRLTDETFTKALDEMQANYSESLGAPKVPKVQWTDIGGLEEIKDEIIKTIKLPLKHPEILKLTGLRRSGILLYGPPGTGKTLMAKAVATECGLCFLSVKGPELLNMYVGQSEKNVREVFERARDASPCIIFFDELDSLAPNRGASGDSGGVMDRVVSQLLAEMDGLNQSGTVFVFGATNRPDLVDPALLRPGRFDKLLYVGPCSDRAGKLSVLKALTRKFRLAQPGMLEKVADLFADNFSGADFYGVCSSAWMSAVTKLIKRIENGSAEGEKCCVDDVIVDLGDFEMAIASTKASIKKEDLDYFAKLKSEFSV